MSEKFIDKFAIVRNWKEMRSDQAIVREVDDPTDPESIAASERVDETRRQIGILVVSALFLLTTTIIGIDALNQMLDEQEREDKVAKIGGKNERAASPQSAEGDPVFITDDPTTNAVFKFWQDKQKEAGTYAAELIDKNPEFAARDRFVRTVIFGKDGLIAKAGSVAQSRVATSFSENAVPFFYDYVDYEGNLVAKLGMNGFFTVSIENQSADNQALHDWFEEHEIPYYNAPTRQLFLPDYNDKGPQEWNEFWYRFMVIAAMDAQPALVKIGGGEKNWRRNVLTNSIGGGLLVEFVESVAEMKGAAEALVVGMVSIAPDSVYGKGQLNHAGLVSAIQSSAESIIEKWLEDADSEIAKFVRKDSGRITESLMYFILRTYVDSMGRQAKFPKEVTAMFWDIVEAPHLYISYKPRD